jgi:hypothetical protein
MTTVTETKTKTESPSFTLNEAPADNPLARADDHGPDQSPTLPRGRMIFALDATASRAATWAVACKVQAEMFREAAPIGKLDVKLVFYGGDYCRKTEWVSSGEELARLMNKVHCKAGYTQIGRVLAHALRETEEAPVQALVFIGDAMEEQIEELAAMAGELGARDLPIFIYQEGRDAAVQKAFRLLALKSGGQYFEFNPETSRAVEQLSEQLGAVARLAMGDTEALERLETGDRRSDGSARPPVNCSKWRRRSKTKAGMTVECIVRHLAGLGRFSKLPHDARDHFLLVGIHLGLLRDGAAACRPREHSHADQARSDGECPIARAASRHAATKGTRVDSSAGGAAATAIRGSDRLDDRERKGSAGGAGVRGLALGRFDDARCAPRPCRAWRAGAFVHRGDGAAGVPVALEHPVASRYHFARAA